ncbi:MAG: hypothetical protein DCC67_04915 [Planctomycetota bacterium]|nr:MAG: hypothetical protein DCC67_04915 [Planctomycetota bacterium]
MSGPAQVRSTEAIEALRAALAKFQQRVEHALDTLDGQLHRAADWIEHDRPAHWRQQTHKAEEAVTQAKVELERCLMFTLAGERPQCREQKAALAEAKARLAYCREKCERVKQWQRGFRHESFEYDGRIGQLRRALEQDLPRAQAVLVNVLRRLEDYRIEQPPEALSEPPAQAASPAATAPASAAVRPPAPPVQEDQ